jgi:hypothetical protein
MRRNRDRPRRARPIHAAQYAVSNNRSSGGSSSAASNSIAPPSIERLDSGATFAAGTAVLVIQKRILHHRAAARHHWVPMTAFPLREPPTAICLLRLSALGDVCHALPVARTLQDAWPGVRLSWVIGKVEHKLLGHIPEIDFHVLDKKAGLAAYRALRSGLPAGATTCCCTCSSHCVRRGGRGDPGTHQARVRPGTGARTAVAVHDGSRGPAHARHVLDAMFGFVGRSAFARAQCDGISRWRTLRSSYAQPSRTRNRRW